MAINKMIETNFNLKSLLKIQGKVERIAIKSLIKTIKFWIDDSFREKVVPIDGSVVYSDL